MIIYKYPWCAYYVHTTMNRSDSVDLRCSEAPFASIPDPIPHIYEAGSRELKEQETKQIAGGTFCAILLYLFLLAALKCRAAHHRKICKWRKIGDSPMGLAKLEAYLGELFTLEAKMLPVDNRLFSAIWTLLCPIVVWILFPKQIAYSYVLIRYFSPFQQIIGDIKVEDCLDGAKNLVYNGRRYKLSETDPYYTEIQDEDNNILYYPTHDLYGLVLPDDGPTMLF